MNFSFADHGNDSTSNSPSKQSGCNSSPLPSSVNDHASASPPPLRVFDPASSQPFNRQALQELLLKTNWLVPNLSSQPLFYQAFLSGKLQPKLDLQFLIDQIVERASIVKSKGQVEFSLILRPEELGEILLTLTSRAGLISIQIQAPAETKKLMDSRRLELELALKKAKLHIEDIQIREVGKNA
ncbi:flagellar hook-length control protein FliK [Candidatus Saganbacteria bacterium]|uniref:Flagellar hook-length control protein FliK n=1 Tax=Candidatus Saganbacteria bacterium TaxID=2575572 RepID=A0A9D6YXW9_UNCSA|nr:flagellar hook-length control protein FliK [Candidatus Saganbacteria bacterium]